MPGKRPNLFIVGAPRCGTTAWVNYLSSHPDVFFARQKEPHYFSEDFPRFRWVKTAAQYSSLFAASGDAKIVGEASVQYLYSKVAARKIYAFNPEARIMIFVRRQSTFLPSYHNQLLYNLDETIMDFETVWKQTIGDKRDGIPKSCREPALLDYPKVGRFDEQLLRYTELFPADQIKVINFESWTQDPRATYMSVLTFLGLLDDGKVDFYPMHRTRRHRVGAISHFTQRPPKWALVGARVVRAMMGRERLGLAASIRRFNRDEGYRSAISDSLRSEIDAYYAESNARLDQLITELG